MRVLLTLLVLMMNGCILEAIGAYTCDAYCSGISDKVENCAEDEGLTFEDFAGGDKATVLDKCQDEIDGRGLSDLQCQAETATINNLSCDQIVDTVADYL